MCAKLHCISIYINKIGQYNHVTMVTMGFRCFTLTYAIGTVQECLPVLYHESYMQYEWCKESAAHQINHC